MDTGGNESRSGSRAQMAVATMLLSSLRYYQQRFDGQFNDASTILQYNSSSSPYVFWLTRRAISFLLAHLSQISSNMAGAKATKKAAMKTAKKATKKAMKKAMKSPLKALTRSRRRKLHELVTIERNVRAFDAHVPFS